MINAGSLIEGILEMLMILALILAIMTAMAGSSRTLYQGSVDGWLPKYLSHVNRHGAPTRAMWTDLVFNLILLSFASSDVASYYFILALSNCGYIIFNFLNLTSAPTIILALGGMFAFVNAAFMGAGAAVWDFDPEVGIDPLWAGLIAASLIIPVFCYRHYVQDKGKFPDRMLEDLGVQHGNVGEKKAGILPYVALAGGLAVMLIAKWIVG
jgi:amino acid transporter